MDNSKSSIDVYNKIATQYANLFDNDLSDNPYMDKFLSKITTGNKILDLGCGTGRVTSYYFDKGFDVTGVDLSPKMLEIAKNKYPKIDFRLGDIRKINFNDTFDGISLAYSLFHLEKKDVSKIIEKITSLLKTSGIIFLILQEGEGEVFVDEPLLPGEKLFLNLYTEEQAKQILSSDFEILSVDKKTPHLKGELPYNKLIILAKKK